MIEFMMTNHHRGVSLPDGSLAIGNDLEAKQVIHL